MMIRRCLKCNSMVRSSDSRLCAACEDEKIAKQLKDLKDKFQSEIKEHENKFMKLNEQLKKQEIELKDQEMQFQAQLKGMQQHKICF